MKIKKETRRAAKKLFRSCFVNSRLDEASVRKTIDAITTNRPRHYLELLTELEKLTRLEAKKYSVLIESPLPLKENELHEIQSQIQSRFQHPLTTKHQLNPSLIGGLRIQVGSNVWDGSVAARLKQLEVRS